MPRPDRDELEITVLGRGVGESIVLHLFNDEWFIIDSFMDYETSLPAARTYLDSIEVDPESVVGIVVSHLHSDHYGGVDELADYYKDAWLMTTEALGALNFAGLFSQDPPLFGDLPGVIARANEAADGSFELLRQGTILHQTTDVLLQALSPVRAAVLASNREIAAAIVAGNRLEVENYIEGDNKCSVVLHLRAQSTCALLGADMVREPKKFGWRAIADERRHAHLGKAHLVKVPHHGGESAHCDEMWRHFVHPDAILKVTPYRRGHPIPDEDDVIRLKRFGELWQASPTASEVQDEFGNAVSTDPVTGIIRGRWRSARGAWDIEPKPPAFPA